MRKLWLSLILAIGGACGHAQAPPQANVLTYCTASNGTVAICPSGTSDTITNLYPQGAVVTYCISTNGALVPCPPASGGAGAGTVTSFSSGNLTPLFTTSVTNGSTTPAQSFTIINAAQNSVLGGPASGGAGPYTFQTAPTFSAANLTSFPTLNQNTTGNAATATALASSPTLCTGNQAATGVLASGNATGCTAYILSSAAPSGTIVGTTDTQTLTNKTLAPTTIVNGDATGTPSVTQWLTSTNTGFTAGIPVGNTCRTTQNFVSGTSYTASADCVTSSAGEQWYFSPAHTLNSPVWSTNQVFSNTMFTTTTPFSANSYSGNQTATFVAGAAAGTVPTVACATSHICDSFSGEIILTTGTAPPTPPGTLLTITLPVSRTNIPNCIVSMIITGTGLEPNIQWTETTTTIVVSLEGSTGLVASTAYPVRYICGGK